MGGSVLLLVAGVGVMILSVLGLLSAYAGVAERLPDDPSVAFAQQNLGPAKLYDRNLTLLYEFEDESEGLRNPVALGDISPFVLRATIDTEDNSFYSNPGVNVRGLARAGVENFAETDVGVLQGSGGSSITQQLAKNVFIEPEERYERSVSRKLREAVYALELTRRYSKDQILEWYLNQIQYGNRANGIGAAARRYFNTSAKDLTLAQSALLAGLPQSPTRYDPYRNLDGAVARQHEVLDLMVRRGDITEAESAAAKSETLNFHTQNVSLLAPHWVFWVRDQLIARHGLETFRNGGLRAVTTLDLNVQNKAEQIIEDKIAFYESPRGGNCQCKNASLVAIDNRNGQILAMAGSRNYWRPDIEGENNNAIAIKQPGSAFKPIVYLAAFEKGWNPGTVIADQPTRFISRIEAGRKEYFTPVGPTTNYLGNMSARDSLASSMNTGAVKASAFTGVDATIDMAHRLGITTLDDRDTYGVSIATGGANLTLLDLTYAYSTIANNGEMRGMTTVDKNPNHRRLDPVSLLKVTNGKGDVLWEYKQPERKQVVQAGYAYQVTDILKDNNAKRHTYTAPEIQFGLPDRRPVAAKTGTQQGPKDIKTVLSTWNFGYVPDLTVGVWVGNADNALVNPNLTSAASSLLIWKEFMAAATTMLNIPPRDFPIPPDIQFEMVNGKREPLVKGPQLAKIIRMETQLPWVVKPDSALPDFREREPVVSGAGAFPAQAGASFSSGAAPAEPARPAPVRRPLVPAATPVAAPDDDQPVTLPAQPRPAVVQPPVVQPPPAQPVPAIQPPLATVPPAVQPQAPPVAPLVPQPAAPPQPAPEPAVPAAQPAANAGCPPPTPPLYAICGRTR